MRFHGGWISAAAATALAGAVLLVSPGEVKAGECPVPSVFTPCPPPPTSTTLPTVPPPSTTTTTQPPPQPRPKPDTAAAARRLLELVNAERTARGLAPLARRGDIDSIAAGHSAAMAAKYDIWHNDSYFTPSTHNALGAVFLGENVAMNPNIESMHKRLMNSPHHRDNILDGRFAQVGIAVAAAPDGELFATEDFAQPRTVKAAAPVRLRPAAVSASPAVALTVPTTVDAPDRAALDADAVVPLPGALVHGRAASGSGAGGRSPGLPVVGLSVLALAGLAGVGRFGLLSAFQH